MTFVDFLSKGRRKILRLLIFSVFQYPRILKYKMISTCSRITGSPRYYQPVLFEGLGKVVFADHVRLGVMQSPYFYTSYIYIDARNTTSEIVFGSNVWINNNCSFISEGEGIDIGKDTLIGANCEFTDSDFHDLDPKKRMGGNIKTGKVSIGRNVFIGSNVKVLKGVCIGDNSVIGNGSIVTKSMPHDVIVAGIPAKVIGKVPSWSRD